MRIVPSDIVGITCVIFAVGSTGLAYMDPVYREKYYGQIVIGTFGALIGLALPRTKEGGSP